MPEATSKGFVHRSGPEAAGIDPHLGEARRPHCRERVSRLNNLIDELGIDFNACPILAEISYAKITNVNARRTQGGTQCLLRPIHPGETA
jgi:hypothetical protein